MNLITSVFVNHIRIENVYFIIVKWNKQYAYLQQLLPVSLSVILQHNYQEVYLLSQKVTVKKKRHTFATILRK